MSPSKWYDKLSIKCSVLLQNPIPQKSKYKKIQIKQALKISKRHKKISMEIGNKKELSYHIYINKTNQCRIN